VRWCSSSRWRRRYNATSQAPSPPPLTLRTDRLGERAWLYSGFANGNVLALVADSGLLLVDAQSSKRVASLDSALQRLPRSDVRTVINSHYHPDHIEGNALWRPRGARIVAHEAVRLEASTDTIIAEYGNWHRTPLPDAAMPTEWIRDSLRLLLGPDTVRVLHVPSAHTNGDLIVRVTGSVDLLHMGDVLERAAPPFIDWWAGGTLDGMIQAVERGIAWSTDRTVVIPGHGPMTDRAGLARYRDMLVTVRARILERPAGASMDTTMADAITAGYADQLGGVRSARRFASIAHYGMSRDVRPSPSRPPSASATKTLAGGTIVIFGGQRQEPGARPPLDELWELSASGWRQRSSGTR